MQVKQFTFNPFSENTYVLYDGSGDCIIVDPGCYTADEKKELTSFIASHNLKVKKLVNTHCHIDHVLGNKFVADTYKVSLTIHKDDLSTLRAIPAYAPSYGFNDYEELLPETYMEHGDTLSFGDTKLEVRFAPGHAPGHVVLYNEADKTCIAGDVLFQRSIGRTDLPGGDFDTLIRSIKEQLFTLPDETVVYCGHGPSTTIGEEKKFNPFLR